MLLGYRETGRGLERRLGQGDGHFLTLPFSQGPQLIIVKVGVPPNTRPRGEGVSQEPVLAIKGVSISVLWNTWGLSFQLPPLGPDPPATPHPPGICPLPYPAGVIQDWDTASQQRVADLMVSI